ncbi:MAG TPA: ABC transporter permease [Stellaceae bacterium]|nr:ABC transporter permease [Stellaceae bacterium]
MAIEVASGEATHPPRARRLLRRSLSLWLALPVLAAILVAAIAGAHLAPHDPAAQNLLERLRPPGAIGQHGRFWLGTDALGRDILSLIIAGAGPAVFVSAAAVASAMAVGVAAGTLAGFYGGRIGDLLLYLTNIQLAFPFFLLAVTIVGILQPSTPLVVAVIAMASWVPFARVTYSETAQIRELEYVEAVRVMRGTTARILWRHILPNVLPNVLVLATFALGTAIVMESGLSFVGLGVPSATPTWGRMLSEGRDYMDTAWWLTVFPGLSILLLVLTINLIGEHLRDYADPKLALL